MDEAFGDAMYDDQRGGSPCDGRGTRAGSLGQGGPESLGHGGLEGADGRGLAGGRAVGQGRGASGRHARERASASSGTRANGPFTRELSGLPQAECERDGWAKNGTDEKKTQTKKRLKFCLFINRYRIGVV